MEEEKVRESLDQLDGTTESALMLLTGLSSQEILDLGGIPEGISDGSSEHRP